MGQDELRYLIFDSLSRSAENLWSAHVREEMHGDMKRHGFNLEVSQLK
ncbi:MAG: hypothetical protein QGI86_06550 [Candidatus Poribacteria bacterium]|nr:hypothetical protein [Candidatus Poribacteria bacterium]MDP6749012.1 hypothetical protein [Candidatus Poribacteria bacterium]MDP6997972.1 hypothetical protein [Candidatus Poribacteria bacterium]